mgnify:CR=1 FL=1|tara:strand:- start:4548 stop:5288 length:741 start_codon:yes stop_codon:yes gene_type:complete
MYEPTGNSKDRTVEAIAFTEAEPPEALRAVVHRFLEVKTTAPLPQDYRFHALPDACTYIVLDQLDPVVAGPTRLRATSEELNLGTRFHYVNIRFLPGVWQLHRAPVGYGMVETAYRGDLALLTLNQQIAGAEFAAQQSALSDFVHKLVAHELVVANPVTEKIFQRLDDIHSVADMAEIAQISARQLQRTLKATTGFTPHDFLKVLRLQQSLRGEPSLSYADQSHFIHSFRKATGYTPGQFSRKFDV